MLDKTKTDSVLGKEIFEFLKKKGVQTPTVEKMNKKNINLISNHMKNIMQLLGLDLQDDSLYETPKRIAKMYMNDLFWGLNSDNFPKCTTVENKMHYNEMVVEKNIKVNSVCEHHFVTIWGKATIAYIPNDKVIGLSKLNRIVEYLNNIAIYCNIIRHIIN